MPQSLLVFEHADNQKKQRIITVFSDQVSQLTSAYGVEVDLTSADALKIQLVQLMAANPGSVNFCCTLNGASVQQLRIKRKAGQVDE